MKALVLISGGLDSLLAAKVIQNQGIGVIGLYFQIPFCAQQKALWPEMGLEIKYIDIQNDFLEIVKNPRHGFGSHVNPCIDCKIFMLQQAKKLMPELQAGFVVTGEVLGQRPMSQNRKALNLIEKESGLEGLLLRPLSARLLVETIPEKEGWVSREELLDFNGRSRRPQMALAEKFKIREYPNAAGGCLLTDPAFAKRLKDLMTHKSFNMESVELLKIGRHFRLNPNAKLVVGRDEKENEKLAAVAVGNDYIFSPNDALAGPTSLGRGTFTEELVALASAITLRYCDLNGASCADIVYKRAKEKEYNTLKAVPMPEGKLRSLII